MSKKMKEEAVETMKTRMQYMSGEVSHHDYYLELAGEAGISFDGDFVERVAKALRKGDEHLNTIPLQYWDSMCMWDSWNTCLQSALKERGDSLSLSVGVCMRKAKAREQALNAYPDLR